MSKTKTDHIVPLASQAVAILRELQPLTGAGAVSYTHLRAHETVLDLVCRLLLEKNKKLPTLGLLRTATSDVVVIQTVSLATSSCNSEYNHT